MAALPRKRDSHLILWNRVQHRPPINAHIPMYAARYRSACALPLNLIWGFETTSIQRTYSIKDLKQQSWKRRPPEPHTGKNDLASRIMTAIAVERHFPFAGRAAAVLVSVRLACRKTCGECPVMPSPGRVRIAAGKTGSATSERAS